MCQVLLFCSHQNQCCAGLHDIVILKSQMQVTDLTSNTDYASLLATSYKLTTGNDTDFSQYSEKGPPGYLLCLCNTFIFHMYESLLYKKM